MLPRPDQARIQEPPQGAPMLLVALGFKLEVMSELADRSFFSSSGGGGCFFCSFDWGTKSQRMERRPYSSEGLKGRGTSPCPRT